MHSIVLSHFPISRVFPSSFVFRVIRVHAVEAKGCRGRVTFGHTVWINSSSVCVSCFVLCKFKD